MFAIIGTLWHLIFGDEVAGGRNLQGLDDNKVTLHRNNESRDYQEQEGKKLTNNETGGWKVGASAVDDTC